MPIQGVHAASAFGVGADSVTIDLELLDLGKPIGVYLNEVVAAGEFERGEWVIRRAAAALVAIHATKIPEDIFSLSLVVPTSLTNRQTRATSRDVLLHGDFGFSNLFVSESDVATTLQIVDHLMPPMLLQHPFVVGPPEWDVAMLVSCLAGRPPTPFFRYRRERVALIRAFCSEYEQLSGRRIELLAELVQLVFGVYLDSRPALARSGRTMISQILVRRTRKAWK